jgi:hypothetical protein
MSRRVTTFAVVVLCLASASAGVFLRAQSLAPGVREASWSPDGKRLVVTWFDQLWTKTPDEIRNASTSRVPRSRASATACSHPTAR